LSDYRDAIFPVGQDLVAAWDEAGIDLVTRSAASFSSSEWATLAELAVVYQEQLKQIEPPDFAADWHRSLIEQAGLQEQVGRAAAEHGVLAAGLVFGGELDEIDQRIDEAREAAIDACPEFRSFHQDWDAIDGNVAGIPVATPAR
jgi:hypothetical protein